MYKLKNWSLTTSTLNLSFKSFQEVTFHQSINCCFGVLTFSFTHKINENLLGLDLVLPSEVTKDNLHWSGSVSDLTIANTLNLGLFKKSLFDINLNISLVNQTLLSHLFCLIISNTIKSSKSSADHKIFTCFIN
ncbi:hypothetical protein IKN40_02285 [bacterium]|nr:hypothetical protein [bacterium]